LGRRRSATILRAFSLTLALRAWERWSAVTLLLGASSHGAELSELLGRWWSTSILRSLTFSVTLRAWEWWSAVTLLLGASSQSTHLGKLLGRRRRSAAILRSLTFSLALRAWERWSAVALLLSAGASKLARAIRSAGSVVLPLLDLRGIDNSKSGECNGSNEEQFHYLKRYV